MPHTSLPLFLASAALLGCQISAIVIPVPVSCSIAGACTQVLNAAFEKCAGAAWCTIELEAGEYVLTAPVYATIINVNNPMNVVLVGSGVDNTILVAQDIGNLFVVSGGSNITFTGFTIDNARPPFTLGTVTSSSPGVSILSVDFNAYPMNEAVYPWLAQVQAVIAYDVAAGRMARGGYDGYFLTNPLHAAYDMGTSTMNLSLQLEVGTTVIMRHQVRMLAPTHSLLKSKAFIHNIDTLLLPDLAAASSLLCGGRCRHALYGLAGSARVAHVGAFTRKIF